MSKHRLLRSKGHRFHAGPVWLLIALLMALSNQPSDAAQNESPPAISSALDQTNSAELLRPYLQLQEQLRGLELSIEENRKAAEAAAAHNAISVADRLQMLEHT